ncbi:MAG: cytochrome C oxidase subunit IV family protein [Alphaproteobacteria bacterium]|nr:cytochrome C oxidase subunit IV family protein [Alphaproteobacteria bacterium]
MVLILLTLCSVELLQGIGGNWGRLPFFSAIMIIAYIKGRIVGLYYMELHSAPRGLRMAFEIWLAVVTIVIILFLGGIVVPPVDTPPANLEISTRI